MPTQGSRITSAAGRAGKDQSAGQGAEGGLPVTTHSRLAPLHELISVTLRTGERANRRHWDRDAKALNARQQR